MATRLGSGNATTPSKTPRRVSENSNPNLPFSSPPPSHKPTPSPASKSKKTPPPKTPRRSIPPPPAASTGSKKATKKASGHSQERPKKREGENEVQVIQKTDSGFPASGVSEFQAVEGSLRSRKVRNLVMEGVRSSIPEPGSGRVLNLVKAFENFLSISKDSGEEEPKKPVTWSSFERDPGVCSSIDSSSGRLSCGSRTSIGDRTSRRNSSDSSERNWNKNLKVTSAHPFKLRTELRGRVKEENFVKRVKEMIIEEERLRVPIANGLPWTTDEPECLVKPTVKEATEPIDLVLHSDVRAAGRAEFDQYVSDRKAFVEQIKLERERQQMLKEEEETKRIRKELVPRARPMPYFDRPFFPKRSRIIPKVPKEPRLVSRAHKECESAPWEMRKKKAG